MNFNQDLNAIFDRIADGNETEKDIQTLRQLLRAREDQNKIQIGKYNVNISEGRDIQIGDRIYQGADAEAIKEALRLVLQEKQKALRPRNEKLLLRAVKEEVVARLKQSLHNTVLINLGKEAQPEQVRRPWSSDIKIGDKPSEVIPDDTSILEVFDMEEIAGKLLILGNPGAGKTTTMLDLAQALITRVEQDANYPIPVLFNLSTWKDDKQPIQDWLVVELKSKYGVRQDIGAKWTDDAKLLPMLDGLDELESVRQERCVKKINEFLQSELRSQYLVICSRWEEYSSYDTQLQLQGAICLRNLNNEQVLNYLQAVKRKDLLEVLQQDEMLLEFLQTPFWLSILVLSEQELQVVDWLRLDSKSQRMEWLLNAYVQRMLERKLQSDAYGKRNVPTISQTKHWLTFLADRLKVNEQTEFSIDSIRPNWLRHRLHKELFKVIFIFSSFLLLACVGWIFGSLVFDWTKGIGIGILSGFLFSWYMISQTASSSVMNRLYKVAEKFEQQLSPIESILEELGIIPNRNFSIEQPIFPVAKFEWSWLQAMRYFLFSIPRNFLLWIIMADLFKITNVIVIYFALFTSGITSFINGTGIFKKVEIEKIVRFDYNIRVSLATACFFSILICVSYRIIFWLLASNSSFDITPVLIIVVLQSVSVWNNCGGGFLIQHFTLRLIISINSDSPCNYARFLDYCTERLLLQRVGGRYRFIHRLIQEHFVAMPLEKLASLKNSDES